VTGANEIADENEEAELPMRQPMKVLVSFSLPISPNPHNFAVNSQRKLGLTCWNLWDAVNWANWYHRLETDDSQGSPNPSSTIMAASHLQTFVLLVKAID
jgi:hypothetical protein